MKVANAGTKYSIGAFRSLNSQRSHLQPFIYVDTFRNNLHKFTKNYYILKF